MRCAMRVAQRVAQNNAVAVMGLDGEGDKTARRQHPRHRREHRREIAEVDEDVGGEDEMIARLERRLGGEEAHRLGFDEPVVDALAARLRQHRRREVDADHPIRRTGGMPRRKARCRSRDRAPSRISCARRLRALDRGEQQLRPAIAKPLGQRAIEIRGVAVEQRAHIGCGIGAGGCAPSRIRCSAAPWRSARVGRRRAFSKAATAASRSPSLSRTSPSANQAAA